MALTTNPAFVGKITITTGKNDALIWREDNGAPFDLSTTIAAGDYWPEDLGTTIKTAMETASAASGATLTYTITFTLSTGIWSIAKSGGSGTFFLKNKSTDVDSVWTGGHTDSGGFTLATDQWGLNHLGWKIESSYPSLGNSAAGAQSGAHYFAPTYPPSEDDDGHVFLPTVIQATAIDGTPVTYDFMGWQDDIGEHPLFGGLSRTRRLAFQFETAAQKLWWIHNFWGPYGKQGKTIRYYPDRSVAIYALYVLTGESLRSHGYNTRQLGYQWWDGVVEMHRVAS